MRFEATLTNWQSHRIIQQMLVQPGTTLKGQFVFIGRVAPQAKFLGLITNSNNNYSLTNRPRMEFKDLLIQR